MGVFTSTISALLMNNLRAINTLALKIECINCLPPAPDSRLPTPDTSDHADTTPSYKQHPECLHELCKAKNQAALGIRTAAIRLVAHRVTTTELSCRKRKKLEQQTRTLLIETKMNLSLKNMFQCAFALSPFRECYLFS